MAEFIRTSKTRVQGENSLSTKGSNNIRSTIENWLRHFANPELSLTEYRDETKYEEELLHPHRQGMGLFTFETSINCIQDYRWAVNRRSILTERRSFVSVICFEFPVRDLSGKFKLSFFQSSKLTTKPKTTGGL